MYRGGIIRKSPEQIEAMAAAGEIQARCLKMLEAKARPGVTTNKPVKLRRCGGDLLAKRNELLLQAAQLQRRQQHVAGLSVACSDAGVSRVEQGL